MRLYEISSLTKDQFIPRPSGSPEDIGKEFGQKDQEEIGSGMYATAFSTPEEPGTVRKLVGPLDKLENDAYFKYVKMLTENDRMSSNPYFPKIFDIQVRRFYRKNFTGKVNLSVKYMYAVDMERLLPFESLSQKEARMLGNKMFYDFERQTKPIRYRAGSGDPSEPRNYFEGLETMITEVFDDWFRERLLTSIKDSRFKQAVMLIRKLETDESIAMDIHSENIMIRRGVGGPQIVITDPVQNR